MYVLSSDYLQSLVGHRLHKYHGYTVDLCKKDRLAVRLNVNVITAQCCKRMMSGQQATASVVPKRKDYSYVSCGETPKRLVGSFH